MRDERVEVTGKSRADPAAVWAVAREFCGRWHPAIETIRAERGPNGALIRAFAVGGEARLYREQLTYLSDSDCVLGYTHLEGIEGVDRYDAWLEVAAADGGGSLMTWSARFAAPGARAAAIAAGTRRIFADGLAALAARAEAGGSPIAETSTVASRNVPLETLVTERQPRLALIVTPNRSGPLCLFLHGIGGGRGNWLPQLRAAGPIMQAAALDFRGYGGSALGDRPSTVDDHCADILAVREVLGADRLILCGLSFGSWVATSFAMRYPELLAGLVLSGGCTGMSEAGEEERERFRVSRLVPLDAGRTPADFASDVVRIIAGPDASHAVRAELIASMAAIPAGTYRDALLCFTNPPERFDLSRLVMPVLLMTGAHDRLASPDEIRGVARRIHRASRRADVRFEVIAGAGHVCNVEQPDAYNSVLVSFLSKVRG